MTDNEQVIKRRFPSTEDTDTEDDLDDAHLALIEEVLLLGLEPEGFISFWNDTISLALRGCILIDLENKGKIILEPEGLRKRALSTRKIIVKQEGSAGNIILDEALKHIKSADYSDNVSNWINYLNGETWNPIKLKYYIRNVRERVSKLLVEKGILTVEKKNYLLFDMTVYPLLDDTVKKSVIKRVCNTLLDNWAHDINLIKKKDLALVLMAHKSGSMENVFDTLQDEDYTTAKKRIKQLLNADFKKEESKSKSNSIMWAVFDTLLNEN